MQDNVIALEHDIILKLAAKLSEDERTNLLKDLNSSRASRSEDGFRVMFEIANYTRPAYLGQHLYPSEGKMNDADGAEISVLLYADENNRLLELEYIRWDGEPICRPSLNTPKVGVAPALD